MKILFVCTGNTCRSPMAEGLLREKIHQSGNEDTFFVYSAGLAAATGEPASEYAKQAMYQRGISIDAHRANLLTKCLLEAVDLVLVMTERHKASIVSAVSPEIANKVYTLPEYTAHGQEIIDPFGQGQAAYDFCAAILEEQIEFLWKKIR